MTAFLRCAHDDGTFTDEEFHEPILSSYTVSPQESADYAVRLGILTPEQAESAYGLSKILKYTPDEARDEQGRWTGDSEYVPPEPGSKPGTGQIRDKNGRFQPTGKPTARERKKQLKDPLDESVVRDEMGRFAAGVLTPKRAQEIGYSIGIRVATAAVLYGTSQLAYRYLPKSIIGPETIIGKSVRRTVTGMILFCLGDAAQKAVYLALRQTGLDAEISKRGSSGVIRFAKSFLKELEKARKEADKESAKASKIEIVDLLVLEKSDETLVHNLAAYVLPPYLRQVASQTIARLDEEGVLDSSVISELDTALHDEVELICSHLESLGKSEESEDLRKSHSSSRGAVSHDRASAVRARSQISSSLLSAFSRSRPSVMRSIVDGLTLSRSVTSSDLQKTDDASAENIAQSVDLSAVRTVRIEDPLSSAASDASYRTLVKIGIVDDDAAVRQAISSSDRLSRLRARSIIGSEADGSTSGGYSVEASTREILQRAIGEGIRDGSSPESIADAATERALGKDRADNIAQYEVDNASSAGTLEALFAARDAGLSVQKSWLRTNDERACVVCRDNQDQGPIPLSEPFASGHMAPQAHDRCRCALVPHVLSGEDQ